MILLFFPSSENSISEISPTVRSSAPGRLMVYAIVHGVEYDLNYGDPAIFEREDDLGMPDLHRLEERGPMQHGSTDRGYRLDPRYPTYVFGITAMTKAQLWDRRTEMLRIFRPSQAVIMKHVLPNGDIRYLDCVVNNGPKMPAQDRRAGLYQKTAVILKADDPTFYDPEAVGIMFENPYGPDLCEVPTAIPMMVGTGVTYVSLNAIVVNSGSVPTYPTIRLTGPLEDPIINNLTTGEKLDFTGHHIAAGVYYDIDLRYAYKTVKDNTGENKISELTEDSDLVLFHLGCDTEVASGINELHISAGGMLNESNASITFLNRSLGI